MQMTRIFGLLLRLILFVLLLILAINNMQVAKFNFLGIYTLQLPLIIILAIFVAIGILIGMLFSLGRVWQLKHEINTLKKELDKQKI